ncbi:hypothetical protein [Winogradskyella forsetii]|uniref:hypothetical protein n=1 Tax=Winogradskyella forsetii TaxID=2686077 RepID=UPI0015BEDC47|nr:hypothetical protein [Winogradskyella forsetii]
MLSIRHSNLYSEVLKELNYEFGDVFIFDGFVISEVKEGVSYSWELHGKPTVKAVVDFLKTDGSDVVYISHRINSYSVVPMDWLKFYKQSLNLKGYGIVTYNNVSTISSVIENLFFKKQIRRFITIESAIQWAKLIDLVEAND